MKTSSRRRAARKPSKAPSRFRRALFAVISTWDGDERYISMRLFPTIAPRSFKYRVRTLYPTP